MSGGLDSSYTAYLLQQQDYSVSGFTLLLSGEDCDSDCCLSVRSAKAVCDKLGIEHNIIDLTDEFQRLVIDNFIEEYLMGRTPNPCVRCNQKIKFDIAFEEILSRGNNKVATGHYVIIEKEKGIHKLMRGVDETKEQSYFLWGLSQEHLSQLLFPLGDFEKVDVREWAREVDLPFEERESQDVCFMKGMLVGDYIREKVETSKGNIVDREGEVLGEHRGIFNFTIGSRKGLDLGGMEEPHYVVEIVPETNEIIVGTENMVYHREMMISGVKTTYRPIKEIVGEYFIQIRYNSRSFTAKVTPIEGDRMDIYFNDPVKAPTPGQSAVIYEEKELIAGGIIDTIVD